MMRHTGGTALGETSTRSRPFSSAMRMASCVGMTPSCPPSSAMTRTSGTRMRRLTRYESWAGGPCGGLEMAIPPLSFWFGYVRRGPATRDRGLLGQPALERVERHDRELLAVAQARRDALGLHLLRA